MANGLYNLRVSIHPRVITGRAATNEPQEAWTETGHNYSARRLAMNAGEEIRQGVKEGVEYLKIEIQGQSIPVSYGDRVKLAVGGKLFRIIGDPIRQERTTILTCEAVQRV